MSQQLISLSPDLKHLRDNGYEVEIVSGYLVIHHIPYVTSQKNIDFGKIIVQLTVKGGIAQYSGNHVVHFMGEYPCYKDGLAIEGIRHGNPNQILKEGIMMNYSFSNKPSNGYKDHYEQVSRYIDIISAPAISIDSSVTPKTFKVIEEISDNDAFQYTDTNESRANIVHINNKFRGQKIAIIGLGGTGSYILDFISKTPVAEIHLFDGDVFSQHNAFRAPGAPMKVDIDKELPKVEYFYNIYSNIHKKIIPHNGYVTEKNINNLAEMSYIFICIDNDLVKNMLIKYLIQMDKTFFDVGLGVNIVNNDFLIGTIRLTTGAPSQYEHLFKRIPLGNDGGIENEYATNIQIADLNAFNAILAIIKWKKLCGFYQDLTNEYHTVYTINDAELLNEDQEIRTQIC